MRTIALKQAPRGHASAVAATVLRGLGVPDEEALAVASLPLPDFPPDEGAAPGAARKARRT